MTKKIPQWAHEIDRGMKLTTKIYGGILLIVLLFILVVIAASVK